ncbi:hypothetical protein P154DRAFT_473400 [Amniculicola lignicola CBS 123094]|uniref:DUF6536 domain-containing protein n=1 Tax=Amniculicola lignicola CBS 123094 TaxID=1392246 RepID=A0A6A5W4D1_9PLEO|nr:hypothetical protein P154DRAFT_473400 [Amniculicola lignicola CBS 123094]
MPQFVRLQVLGLPKDEQPTAPDARTHNDDDLEDQPRLEPSNQSLTCFYSLLRFIRSIASIWNNRFPGWRGGIAGYTIFASIILILNIAALAWTATHLDGGHYATIAMSSYKDISKLSGQVQFGINILSTALLAGSNYCMQCLSSPTRAEVDAVHARGSYLNIGTLSWRNALTSRKRRICLLSLLALSSVVMPPIYNVSFAMTIALQSYTSAIVTHDFRVFSLGEFLDANHSMAGISWTGEETANRFRYIQSVTTNEQIQDKSLWNNISALECAQYNVFQTDSSTLLVVINETPEQILSYQDPRLVPYASPNHLHLLPAFTQHRLYPSYSTMEKGWASTSEWHTRISYCLSRKVPGRSRLQIHLWLFLTATVLNAIKLGCLILTFKEQTETPLVTTGDAIASFLKSPCVHSTGMCLLSQEEIVRKLQNKQDLDVIDAKPTYKNFQVRQLRYHHSVSLWRWMFYISSFILIMLFSVYECNTIKKSFQDVNIDYNLQSLWKLGLGTLNEHSLTETTFCDYKFSSGSDNKKWVQCRIAHGGANAMVLTNLPQLAVSAIYLSLNHKLTLMVQLRDWTSLASRRQALRVSDPEPTSNQKSTYWLSLPYWYSIPLLVISISLSWLVSQTLFIVRYALYEDMNINHVPDVQNTIGYSAIALICSIVFGLAIFGVSVGIGFCKCAPGMPLGPSNSLVVAAACHPPKGDCHAARMRVKWGALPMGDNCGNVDAPHHCTITSRKVEDPVDGRKYE